MTKFVEVEGDLEAKEWGLVSNVQLLCTTVQSRAQLQSIKRVAQLHCIAQNWIVEHKEHCTAVKHCAELYFGALTALHSCKALHCRGQSRVREGA